MADNDNTTRFPYQHLAVLGVEKLKKYIPPAVPVDNTARTSSPRMNAASPRSDALTDLSRTSSEK
jgi:hypothetical protein